MIRANDWQQLEIADRELVMCLERLRYVRVGIGMRSSGQRRRIFRRCSGCMMRRLGRSRIIQGLPVTDSPYRSGAGQF